VLHRFLGCFLSASLLLCVTTQAQSRNTGKDSRKSAYQESLADEDTPKPEKKRKKKKQELPDSKKRDRYRIDVLIPLYLDELVKDNKVQKDRIPEKALAGVLFYEGIRLAVDTLTTMGYNTDIVIHDIAGGSKALLNEDSLGKSDLLLGFVPTAEVAEVAEFAQKRSINFVSAYSPSDAGISRNPFFFLINPTLEHHCATLAAAINKKRNRDVLIVYKRSSQNLDSTACAHLLESEQLKNFTEVNASLPPDSATLDAAIDTAAVNTIVMPIMDPAYAASLLTDLHRYFPETRFEIYGMPTWKSIVSDKRIVGMGAHMAINMTQPYYFDPTVSAGLSIDEACKEKYGTKAGELTYRGFELCYWMVDLLNKYGTIFNEKTADNGMALFTKFDLKPKWDSDNNFYYYENTHLYLYRYVAGSQLVE
jgi:hypothetical protein